MKKFFGSMVAIVAFSFSSLAQEQLMAVEKDTKDKSEQKEIKNKSDKKVKYTDELFQKLNLSAEQKDKLKNIEEEYNKELVSIEATASAKEIAGQKQSLLERRLSNIYGLLTPEQVKQLETLKKEDNNNKPKDNGEVSAMKKNLGLSDYQIEKMNEIDAAFNRKENQVKTDLSLTTEQKEEQINGLKRDISEKYKGILSPAQIAKLDEMNKTKTNSKPTKQATSKKEKAKPTK